MGSIGLRYQLLFGKPLFFQQECFHIGQDETGIEGRGTVDVSDTTVAIDEKHAQDMIHGPCGSLGLERLSTA